MDLGAGEGRVLASAMKCGAKSVIGYELPANSAHKYVYDAVLRRIFAGIINFNLMAPFAQWLAKDIDQVFIHLVVFILDLELIIFLIQLTGLPEETEIVYSFWNGMPYPTQLHILKLSASCRTVRRLAVFRDDKWSSPDDGYFRFDIFISSFSLVTPAFEWCSLWQWFKY